MKKGILKEPYPFEGSNQSALKKAFFFGLFVFLFLYFFQPFGLNNYDSSSKTAELLGFGAITMIVLVLNHILFKLLFPNWYQKKGWTVGKNIVYASLTFFCIGFGNLCYAIFLNYLTLSLESFLFYQGVTLMVGILPVTISTLAVYNKRLKKLEKEAKELNESIHRSNRNAGEEVLIPSKNKSEEIKIDIHELLTIKAIENYVEVYFLDKETIKKELVRNTLRATHDSLTHYSFIKQCHRSYLINIKKVHAFTGNAQGLNLNFGEALDIEVPVSRKYVQEIKKGLKE